MSALPEGYEGVCRAESQWSGDVVKSVVSSLEELTAFLAADKWVNVACRPLLSRWSGEEWRGYEASLGEIKSFVAYDCYVCQKIITGMPDVRRFDEIGILAGSKGVAYHCSQCNTVLHKDEYEFS